MSGPGHRVARWLAWPSFVRVWSAHKHSVGESQAEDRMEGLRTHLAYYMCLGTWPVALAAQPGASACARIDSITSAPAARLESIGHQAASTEHYLVGYCALKRLDAIDPTRTGIAYDLAVSAMETGRFGESTRYFARAEQEASKDATTDRWSLAMWMDGYGRVAFGDTAGARAVRDRLASVDPAHAGVTGIDTYLAHFARRFDDARRPMRDRIDHGVRVAGSNDLWSGVYSRAYAHIGDAFLAAGLLDSARAAYEQALALDTAVSVGLTGHTVSTSLASIALAQGRSAEATRLLRRSEDRIRRALADSRDSQVYPYDMAAVCALRGDTAAALTWLDRALDHGWRKAAFTRFDPLLASLHGSPTFARIVARDDSLSAAERRSAWTLKPSKGY